MFVFTLTVQLVLLNTEAILTVSGVFSQGEELAQVCIAIAKHKGNS